MLDTPERIAELKMSVVDRQKLKEYLSLRFEPSTRVYPYSVYGLKQGLSRELDLYTTQEEYRDVMLELGFELANVEYVYSICTGNKIKNSGFYFKVKDSKLWLLRENAHRMINRYWHKRSGMARRSVVKFREAAKGTAWENDKTVEDWVEMREEIIQIKERLIWRKSR